MVDAEEHRTPARYAFGVLDLDALEEEPDPEPRDHPDGSIEGRKLLLDVTIPSPHPFDEHRRKRQEAGETEPAFCPVHSGPDGFDLIREEVRQPECQRNAEQ